MIYIGAESIISPLGASVEANWSALVAGKSGIALQKGAGFGGKDLYLSKMPGVSSEHKFEQLISEVLKDIASATNSDILKSRRTLVLISSTKGAVSDSIGDPFLPVVSRIARKFDLGNTPVVISNACISGVSAINIAAGYVSDGLYEHVIVVGCDVIADFVVYGFQSLYATSEAPCKPFDAARSGISLGEACAAVVISGTKSAYHEEPLQLLDGATSNDANHISGPSRTGEGLVRSVNRTLSKHGLSANEIDMICAHGTATVYNDEMESIAFGRLQMEHIPVNSLKGFFGHTLGAAGVVESVICMQMLRNGLLLKSNGFEKSGTSVPINVLMENHPKQVSTILKTASGFGGGNSSLMIRKL